MKRKKLVILLVSIFFSLFVLSTGYGLWQNSLVIKGRITVSRPPHSHADDITMDQTVIDAIYLEEPCPVEKPFIEEEMVTDEVYQEDIPSILTDIYTGDG